jgi:hypothetical protein
MNDISFVFKLNYKFVYALVVKASGTFYPTYSLDKSKITSNGGTVMDLSAVNGMSESNG